MGGCACAHVGGRRDFRDDDSFVCVRVCVCVGGLRHIRDTFMDFLGNFANFTAEIMRDDDEDSSDNWER